uniref:Uncharacterized protein n=1 Tax=Rhizophora mucronata TaxID=61149 RepID=A0A2P2PMM3_RHIMU
MHDAREIGLNFFNFFFILAILLKHICLSRVETSS